MSKEQKISEIELGVLPNKSFGMNRPICPVCGREAQTILINNETGETVGCMECYDHKGSIN